MVVMCDIRTDLDRDAERAIAESMLGLRRLGRPQNSQTVPFDAVKRLLAWRGESLTLDEAWASVDAALIHLRANRYLFAPRSPKMLWRMLK